MKAFMSAFFAVFSLLFLAWAGTRIYLDVNYNIHVGGRLQRAANANTVETAQEEMRHVVAELERRGWTKGSTNILWWEPSNDVGFWYNNLKASLEELQKVRPETTQLERSNLLIKLRETILDHGDSGSTVVTAPPGISLFPNNVGFCIWGWGSFLLFLLACIGLTAAIFSDN